jgi:hypothetical protein
MVPAIRLPNDPDPKPSPAKAGFGALIAGTKVAVVKKQS